MPKSLIRMRREAGATCYNCGAPDYRIEPNETPGFKPWIICNGCGHRWQYGRDGGIYAELSGNAAGSKKGKDEQA